MTPYWTDGQATIWHANALDLPLPDASVDLVVTSPPYFGLRSYQDAGEHYTGQLGSEPTPAEFVDALIAATREMVRVLKPSGSLWINLGDKYASDGISGPQGATGLRANVSQAQTYGATAKRQGRKDHGVRAKSLIGIPWRYALRCIDDLGLILRAEVIWSKPNGLPESVTDRVRRSHEQWFHFTLEPRYYSAVDEVREEHAGEFLSSGVRNPRARYADGKMPSHSAGLLGPSSPERKDGGTLVGEARNPLGKLPGSVWTIPTQPLRVPDHLGVDHFAAYPMEFPRRIIRGWSPREVCTACGEGRRPVADVSYEKSADDRRHRLGSSKTEAVGIGTHHGNGTAGLGRLTTITGYACACTPYTDHPDRRGSSFHNHLDDAGAGRTQDGSARKKKYNDGLENPRGPVREYHFDQWTPAPTTPGVVLDPFGGTGTTALVAAAEGRTAHHVDLSADYCRLAQWRITDPGERARAREVEKPAVEMDGQDDLLGLLADG